ncbi:hypothetical protein RIF29_10459 [Crotalaria pallida]|uniref:Uncharacterized protein n=1 Tax=Crotalaria pallida TaxID=3830 RepID=A0AAN9G039_CROPI
MTSKHTTLEEMATEARFHNTRNAIAKRIIVNLVLSLFHFELQVIGLNCVNALLIQGLERFHEFLKLENEVNTRDNATSDSEGRCLLLSESELLQNSLYDTLSYHIRLDYYPKIGLFEGEESMLADISEDPSSFKELRDGTRASQPSSSNSNARYFSTVFYMFLMEPRGDPLGRDCAEFIVESTGVFTDKDKADSHLKAETRYINPFKKLHHRLESACPKKCSK